MEYQEFKIAAIKMCEDKCEDPYECVGSVYSEIVGAYIKEERWFDYAKKLAAHAEIHKYLELKGKYVG